MRNEYVEFTGSLGTTLAGSLDLPDAAPRAFALFAHCFTCSKDIVAASRIAKALTDFDIAVLRFDFTGLGGSLGDFANTNFSSNIEDLLLAADHLREHHRPPTFLIGHSLGGAAVLAAAEKIPEIAAVATIAAPAGTEHLLHLLSGSHDEIVETGEAEVTLASRPFRVRKQFLDDIADQPQTARIGNLDAALLVMHSPTDETVGVDNARLIFEAARHPKSFVSLDGADHLLTRPADAKFAASILGTWASRYLDEPLPAEGDQVTAPAEDADASTVTVSENQFGPYGQDVTVGDHVMTADEPVPVGQGAGPSPYDFVLAGLGACTSMTIRMYAERQEWPLQHVSVSMRHSRIHAEDCADCETDSGQLDRIDRVITLTGTLDEGQREKLLDIADRCPVHRTLHSEINVRTSLS